jgi:copper homeostasis protein
MIPIKEVCVESFEEAVRATKAGATRIELCDNLSVGGTTPSFGTIKQCMEKLPIPILVMIRPRGGNFVYSADEFEIMKEDIVQCKALNVPGVVFGLLDQTGNIDLKRTEILIKLSEPMAVTFHKAIDETTDILSNTKLLKSVGISRILSSGGKATAAEGQVLLNQMIEVGKPQLSIVVAGKVTYENFDEIRLKIPASEYHGRKLVQF